MINIFDDLDFVFGNDYRFPNRYDENPDYFTPSTEVLATAETKRAMWRTNLISDIADCELPLDNQRSPGYRRIEPHMAGGYFWTFVGEHMPGKYSKAHAHESGAVLICIRGEGYTLNWPVGYGPRPWESGHGDVVERTDYVAGGMVAAAPGGGEWFHQHFGSGSGPLRFLVFFGGAPGTQYADYRAQRGAPKAWLNADVEEGGRSIGYRQRGSLYQDGVRSRAESERDDDANVPRALRLIRMHDLFGADGESTHHHHHHPTDSLRLDEEEVHLLSVGIDIGSATSQLVFTRIVLELIDGRYRPARTEVLHSSPVTLTPYTGHIAIDSAVLAQFIQAQYAAAGLTPDDISSGAVILTGLALERPNSRLVADLFGSTSGDLVAVAAGDRLEAELAAHGSGAVARSAREAGIHANIDMGGGTTKIALCSRGEILAVGAVDVGARLVRMDAEGRIEAVEPVLRSIIAERWPELRVGEVPAPADLHALAGALIRAVLAYTGLHEASPFPELERTSSLVGEEGPAEIVSVSVSGGVSEYYYGRTDQDFGDLGRQLAGALQGQLDQTGCAVSVESSGIRATVLGASRETVQLSGTTIFATGGVLPLRNVPVVELSRLTGDASPPDEVAAAVQAAVAAQHDGTALALVLPWVGSATADRIEAVAEGFAIAHREMILPQPLVLICAADVAGLVGRAIARNRGWNVDFIAIDGLTVGRNDYIDIGEPIGKTRALPVVVKTLLFPKA